MKTTVRALARSASTGSLVLAVTVLGGATADADSGDVEYQCEYYVQATFEDRVVGEGTATAAFDTAVPDGLVVDVGETVSLERPTGTITLPDEFTDALRAAGVTNISGGAHNAIFVVVSDSIELLGETFLSMDATTVPGEGSLSLNLRFNTPFTYEPQTPGTHAIALESFFLGIPDNADEAGISCAPVDSEFVVIDTLEAVGASTPTATTTPTASASPPRPVTVQTDFADRDDSTPALVLGAGALLTLTAGAIAVGRTHRGSRRH